MFNQIVFNKICKDIKSLKIQSATTLARKAFYAYTLVPTEESKKKLLSLRPTEPMLINLFEKYNTLSYSELTKKLEQDQEKINEEVFKLIKNGDVIFTHCHATSIINALIYSRKKGKHFEVYNTETRPKYQGRKTSKELRRAGIKTTMFVDAAALTALTCPKSSFKGRDFGSSSRTQDQNITSKFLRKENKRKVDFVLLGADAITKKGVINKIGSGMYAELAKLHKIPFYIVSNSLKYSNKPVVMEERNPEEVWKNKDSKEKIKIENPAFELVQKQDITAIITEFGNLKYSEFLKKIS